MRSNAKLALTILGGILLATAPAWAGSHKKGGGGGGGGGESMAGGLPALEDRVEFDEGLITILQGQVATLQSQVTDLQGQNNWAVVSAAGSIVRSKPNSGLAVEHTALTGAYEVTFTKDVSACAYEATIGDTANFVPVQGQIAVSGDIDSDNPNDVFVQTFDATGTKPTDMPFHLYVSCP